MPECIIEKDAAARQEETTMGWASIAEQ